ncbi:hypothetical protein CS374_05125 [Porphyromonas gingivalis]|nr:hypothetical protein CS374_05125 [Porphyromonas gingivalis]
MRSSCKQLLKGGIYNYFHSLLPPLSLAPFMPRTPLPSTSLFFKRQFDLSEHTIKITSSCKSYSFVILRLHNDRGRRGGF